MLCSGMVKLLLTAVQLLLKALLTAKLLTPRIPFKLLPDFAILASVIAKMLLPIVLLLYQRFFVAVNSSPVAASSSPVAVNSSYVAVNSINCHLLLPSLAMLQ